MGRSFRLFKPYSGKTTFESLNEPMQAGDYARLKGTASLKQCVLTTCGRMRSGVLPQNTYLLLKRTKSLYCGICRDPYNPANLNNNLVTQLNLLGVPVILENETHAAPAYLSTAVVPYIAYRIDPSGNLFGNTICGANNFTEYVEYTKNA